VRGPGLKLGAFATVGLAVALGLTASRDRALAVYAYLLLLSALLVLRLVRRTHAGLPSADAEALVPRARPRREEPPIQLNELVRAVAMSRLTALDVHYRLRPLVRTIAAARLSQRHGADLDREPERARDILGDGAVWQLVRPDRPEPEERLARGIRVSDLERVVDELEAL
jgi:hypothetical protein